VIDAEDSVDQSSTESARDLFDRVADRQISAEDLYKLKLWREAEPEAPEGPWYKDFGSLKICGEGALPKTFLLKGQAARGHPGKPDENADYGAAETEVLGGRARHSVVW